MTKWVSLYLFNSLNVYNEYMFSVYQITFLFESIKINWSLFLQTIICCHYAELVNKCIMALTFNYFLFFLNTYIWQIYFSFEIWVKTTITGACYPVFPLLYFVDLFFYINTVSCGSFILSISLDVLAIKLFCLKLFWERKIFVNNVFILELFAPFFSALML